MTSPSSTRPRSIGRAIFAVDYGRPMPYHENLLSAVLPKVNTIVERIDALLSA